MRKIQISDYTLKTTAQTRSAPLLFREKTALAAGVVRFGADVVELCAVRNLKEDMIIDKTIAAAVGEREICIPVGVSASDVEDAWSCIREAANPCLQVSMPVSTVQMEYIYHMKEAKMSEKIQSLCAAAKALCENVEFEALDATRADPAFLTSVCRTAVESGAVRVTLCDDAGLLLPEEFAALVGTVRDACGAPVFVRVSDKMHMAAACAVACIRAGADGVKTAVAGEDALLTADFADAIAARGESLGVYTDLMLTEIHNDVDSLIRTLSRTTAETTEGTADDGRDSIYLDADSTLPQVAAAVSVLGYELSNEDVGSVYKAMLHVCEKKGSVGARELDALVASTAIQVPSTYHVESYGYSSGNFLTPMANVILLRDGERLCGVSVGDGPIDACFRAIEQCIGYHYELDKFEIQAVTEGKEALGSALVRLRNNGKLYSGDGLSTDIVGASVRAYINALNKIVFESNEEN